jgi:hypothetical protein
VCDLQRSDIKGCPALEYPPSEGYAREGALDTVGCAFVGIERERRVLAQESGNPLVMVAVVVREEQGGDCFKGDACL